MKQIGLEQSRDLGVRFRALSDTGNSTPKCVYLGDVCDRFGGQFNRYMPMSTAGTASWHKRERPLVTLLLADGLPQ